MHKTTGVYALIVGASAAAALLAPSTTATAQTASAGAPWRDVPECFGSWRAVYGVFVQDRHGRVAAGLCRGVGSGDVDGDVQGLHRDARAVDVALVAPVAAFLGDADGD